MPQAQFILASQSPRRADLLRRYGFHFEIQPADIDESRQQGEAPAAFVQRLAQEKAAAINLPRSSSLPVLGSDTIVVLGDSVLGKPRDQDDACNMLQQLSGRRHQVMTAVCVRDAQRSETQTVITEVDFVQLTPAIIAAYWASGEPQGKAGAYAIQGLAEAFVREIHGSYSAVVGLPIQQTLGLLKLFAIEPPVFCHE